ncbi:Nit6803 family nitrilase [Vibrio mangrovi]|uniref:Aliphatic nitrilase n=1 Tax=Vibrio mangrovi TaxID=474394 RepID=A0A1Y6J2U6_9VIBR|nr:Nit6803 family nitrilase [Vibrio mangrovi]MDW6005157.1 Nit6803 family nitriliase [Vibrio mangrovi]SMS02633.1 Aliphatic nitrilase [Vibrio mangrovi]
MHKKIVRAAAVQISPDLESLDGTLSKVLKMIDQAAEQGVELIVFPETFLPYYPYFSFIEAPAKQGKAHLRLYEQAVHVPGKTTQAIADKAKEHHMVVVVGVNERAYGTLFNTQLIFNDEGELVLKRRKITPTYHERMIWGQGDASGLKVVETAKGRIGALACWEHYNPLARYCLMTQHEQIHCSQFPGSLVGPVFAEQMDVTIRHHALESGCFVVNSTGWLTEEQIARITTDPELQKRFRGGCHTAIVSPEGKHLVPPIVEGEGLLIADLDFSLIDKRKRMMDSVGHYARPELLSLKINREVSQYISPMAGLRESPEPQESVPGGIN